MASLEKYTHNTVIYELRHNTRENSKPSSNIDIDPSRTELNYTLHPSDRGCSARECKEYYNQRIKEVYHYRRADVKTACQWVITAPRDLKSEDEKLFFQETYTFLNSLYKEENCVQAIVHYDEGVKDKNGKIIEGRPHLHYVFIPTVENKKYLQKNKNGNITKSSRFKEKVCANELINKSHLSKFHPRYQKWMDDRNIKCTVYSGITGGKNRTVKEIKAETREILKLKERIHEIEESNRARILKIENENNSLRKKINDLERERTIESSWGSSSGWGNEVKEWEIEY